MFLGLLGGCSLFNLININGDVVLGWLLVVVERISTEYGAPESESESKSDMDCCATIMSVNVAGAKVQ